MVSTLLDLGVTEQEFSGVSDRFSHYDILELLGSSISKVWIINPNLVSASKTMKMMPKW